LPADGRLAEVDYALDQVAVVVATGNLYGDMLSDLGAGQSE